VHDATIVQLATNDPRHKTGAVLVIEALDFEEA
jgi:hypothetical protein